MSARHCARVVQTTGLYLLVVLLPFSKAAVEISFGLMLIGWLWERLQPGGWATSVWSRPHARPLLLALATYLAVCALTIVTSSNPALSCSGFIRKTVEYALLCVMAAELAGDPVVARRCLYLLVGSACALSIDTLVQYATGFDLARHRALLDRRITGPYENPNDLATYLVVLIPLLLSLVYVARGWQRLASGVVLAMLVAGLLSTGAVGAYVGLAVGLGIMCVISAPLRRGLLWFGGLAAVAATAVFYRVDSLTMGVRDRWYMWQAAWGMVRDRPVLGHGLNTFMANYLAYRAGGQALPRYAHNCYLQAMAETGVVGLAAFLWWLGAIMHTVVRAAQAATDPRRHCLLAGCVGGLSAFLMQAMLDTNFYSLRQAAMFWTLAGAAIGAAWAHERLVPAAPSAPAPLRAA